MATPRLHHINQSVFYKLASKKKLSNILSITAHRLKYLAASSSNYKVFPLEEDICPFTGKITKERWVQQPKDELRILHERIKKLLMRISPPDYAHAAVKGKSYRTNALIHVRGKRIATFDIKSFYPSTSKSRIFSFFTDALLCTPDIASILANLCCYIGPENNAKAGLPTGSPLSPILSLYANKPFFDELNVFSQANNLKFTCYVDDLTFSGDELPKNLTYIVGNFARKHGHKLSIKKTRLFHEHQSKHVTGIVIYKECIRVPYFRFFKARKISDAANATHHLPDKLIFTQRLAGLLGEAAYLDENYKNWAKRTYSDLKSIRTEIAKELLLNSAISIPSPAPQQLNANGAINGSIKLAKNDPPWN